MQYPLAAAQVHYKQAGPQYKMLIIIIIPARTLTQQQHRARNDEKTREECMYIFSLK
jgi:hypothetical protein